MPVISRFYGIAIYMFFEQAEHNPPHVHVVYADYKAELDIRTGRVLAGRLPKRALKMVREWISKNRVALMQVWETQEFIEIPPLK